MLHKDDRESLSSQLQELGYSTYNDFLESKEWKSLKNQMFMSQAFKTTHCSCCNRRFSKSLSSQMHHVSYEDLLDSDNIMPVCRTCHKQCHDVSELKGINILQATKIVKKENKPKYKKMKRKKAGIEPQKMSRVAYHKALARKQGLLTNKRGEIVDKWGKTIQ